MGHANFLQNPMEPMTSSTAGLLFPYIFKGHLYQKKLSKLRRHANRVHFASNSFGPMHFVSVFVHTSTKFSCYINFVSATAMLTEWKS